MIEYWVSCKKFTVWVSIDSLSTKIIDCAPVVRKFKGQPFDNLRNWFGKFGGLRVVNISHNVPLDLDTR